MADEDEDELLALAVVGARARGFNHDAASKLQRLIMSMSELDELAPPTGEVRVPIAGLAMALGELEGLFAEFRALAKGTEAVAVDLHELCAAAARRAGCKLAVEGDLPDVSVHVREAEAAQVLALLVDDRAALTVRATLLGDRVALAIPCTPRPIALALARRMFGATATPAGVELQLRLSK